MIDVVHQHNGVVDHNAGHHDHPDEGDGAHRDGEDRQRQHHTHQTERHRRQNDEGMQQRFELCRHHQIGQHQRQDEGELHAGEGVDHIPPLPGQLGDHAVLGRHVIEHRLHVGGNAAQVAPVQIGGHQHYPALVDAADLVGALGHVDRRHRRQGHRDAAHRGDDQAGKIRDAGAVLRPRAHPERDVLIAAFQLGRHFALQLGGHDLPHRRGVQVQLGQLRAVQVDHHFRTGAGETGADVGQPGDRRQALGDRLRRALHQRGRGAADACLHGGIEREQRRTAERDRRAGHARQRSAELSQGAIFGAAPVLRVQIDQDPAAVLAHPFIAGAR